MLETAKSGVFTRDMISSQTDQWDGSILLGVNTIIADTMRLVRSTGPPTYTSRPLVADGGERVVMHGSA